MEASPNSFSLFIQLFLLPFSFLSLGFFSLINLGNQDTRTHLPIFFLLPSPLSRTTSHRRPGADASPCCPINTLKPPSTHRRSPVSRPSPIARLTDYYASIERYASLGKLYLSDMYFDETDNGCPALGEEPPADGAEWVELLVREVLSAPNVEDAKARISRALEALEKSICVNTTAEAAKSFQQENILLKQQLVSQLQENDVLKRAVSIQLERQKEVEAMGNELHQLKQLVSQYQEQLRNQLFKS
ncbi:hypothetical protein ACS0TY_006502 [Phlomoides rotata]